jgi:2-dehydropantoate 2-reductase
MRICILGCGAIGGLLAGYLAKTDVELTLVDRGEQYRALREKGLILRRFEEANQRFTNLNVVNHCEDLGRFDYIFLAVKAHEIGALAAGIRGMLGQGSVLVTLQNGIPWWYFQRHGGALEGRVIETTDPGGQLAGMIDAGKVIGCVAYPAAEIVSPGVVRHIEGIRFPVGELDGQATPRLAELSQLLVTAGLKSPMLEDIRSEIWLKAWGNAVFNPVSALTHATMAEIARFPPTRDVVADLMREVGQVAGALGITFRVPLERVAGCPAVAAHGAGRDSGLRVGVG